MSNPSLEARAAKAEARLRQIRNSGDQQQVLEAARECANLYAAMGDPGKESEFRYELGKCQILTGAYAAALESAETILDLPKVQSDPVFKAQVLILCAAALRNQSHHERAVATAREALAVMEEVEDRYDARAEAYQGIIACLVEAENIDEAWDVHNRLSTTLRHVDDTKLAGQGFWTLGNLAFAKGHLAEGFEYHGRAADRLQKINDIHLWARFNNASADVQLQAGVANQQTDDCIARAQLAYDIIGGTAVELLGLAGTRARWYFANGRLEEASNLLEKALADAYNGGAPEDASVHRLWSQVLDALGRHEESNRERANADRIERSTES
ncbi:hypothetical protein Q2T94_15205 [Paeniglutamicibacter sulfureus]|uniref:hypothetical protein n=1 Tax=Paeniglutamicibacter sulfureus TaxID=43666 RepID=UPI00266542B3|nr:hypothetical protein [Paeniglutamicibacter sulfureus]MDO2935655.1 hypothetical protein [Paeniglutamicibacter sulfureus]